MNLPAAAVIRPSYAARSLASAEVRQRWQLRRVSITWYLLVLNAATFYKGLSGFPIPGSVGKIITQGALPLALVFALSVNRKLLIRPNLFLCLVGLLVLDTILTMHGAAALRDLLPHRPVREFYVGAVAAHSLVGTAGPVPGPLPPAGLLRAARVSGRRASSCSLVSPSGAAGSPARSGRFRRRRSRITRR